MFLGCPWLGSASGGPASSTRENDARVGTYKHRTRYRLGCAVEADACLVPHPEVPQRSALGIVTGDSAIGIQGPLFGPLIEVRFLNEQLLWREPDGQLQVRPSNFILRAPLARTIVLSETSMVVDP